MKEGQYVILKGNKDGISILLDEQADFELIKKTLQKKVAGAKQFFEGANTNVAFKGRKITDEEEKTLLDIIFTETTLDVSFVEQEGFTPVTPSYMMNATPSHYPFIEQVTKYQYGGLRSGQFIRYGGSVVVIGDANPGSEIIAGGNVIVLGALKGLVHAGCNGDDSCFVSALTFAPTQLRIASIITNITSNDKTKRKKANIPTCAYIQDGQVYIAPLLNN